MIRPINCIMAMLGVGLGAYMIHPGPFFYGPVTTGLMAFLVCAAGNIVNDLVDVDIDRVNRPTRVLVKRMLSRKYVVTLAVLLNLLAILIALSVNAAVALMAVLAIGLLFAYNLYLKRVPFVGNVVIALLGGMTFLTGGIAVNTVKTFQLPGPLVPAAFAFLFHIVREIIKDVDDIEGDRQVGVRTFPQVVGVRAALVSAGLLFFGLVVLTIIPVLAGWFGFWYGIVAIVIIDLPLIVLLIFICHNPSRRLLRVGSLALKLGMIVGIVALLIA